MITYALIGCGRIAKKHIEAACSLGEELKLCALCDVDRNRAQALRPAGSGARIYTDAQLMILAERPKLVAIATDSGSHAELALAAIEAGCHVMVEKPMALSLGDAARMIEAARQKGVLLSVCHQNRFNPAVEALTRAISSQSFVRISHAAIQIRWHRDQSYYSQAAWRGTWEKDGGALMNQGIHAIDLLCMSLGGRPLEVFAYTANRLHPYLEVEDLGVAVFRFEGGALGVAEGSVNIYPENLEETLAVFGENGTFVAGGTSLNQIEHWAFCKAGDKAPEAEHPADIYGFGHKRLYEDVISAIKTGTPLRVSGKEGYKALEMVLGIYCSAREHRPVSFPLEQTAGTLQMRQAALG